MEQSSTIRFLTRKAVISALKRGSAASRNGSTGRSPGFTPVAKMASLPLKPIPLIVTPSSRLNSAAGLMSILKHSSPAGSMTTVPGAAKISSGAVIEKPEAR